MSTDASQNIGASTENLMRRALAAHTGGQSDEATALYRAVLARQPHNLFARHNLGMLEVGHGSPAAGMRRVRQAVAGTLDPRGTEGSAREVGLALARDDHLEAALPWLEQAHAETPADPTVSAALGRARPVPHLAPEVHDPGTGRVLLRPTPRESRAYVYAVDVVGTCNLRCPTCPVGNFPEATRPRGFMPLDVARRVVEKIAREAVCSRPEVWLFNWGEPLLHPDLPAIIETVNAHGLEAHLSTNLNVRRGLEAAIAAHPASLKISLSGFTQESYARTHTRGKLELVIENMERLRACIDRTGAPTVVWVGHHLYKGNLDQLDAVRAACARLGFAHRPIPAFYQPLEKLVGLIEGTVAADPILDELLEHPTDYARRFATARDPDYDCELRANQTAINFDGTVALCCSVYDAPNMLGVHFLDAPHTEIEARKYTHPFCRTCMSHGLQYAPLKLPDALADST
ncbi:MAG: radical SAM protein [Ectothiorhodospiraceae bacterium]|nr:radical SAM protein [Ectothiorhodospiraceae bacterium]